MYLGSVEVNEVLKKLNHPEQQLQGCTLSAEPWPEINQIILHCLEEDVTKEFLEAYFKNEGMSGSPTFVEVTMKGKGIAVVTLQGSQGRIWNTTLASFCVTYLMKTFLQKINDRNSAMIVLSAWSENFYVHVHRSHQCNM